MYQLLTDLSVTQYPYRVSLAAMFRGRQHCIDATARVWAG